MNILSQSSKLLGAIHAIYTAASDPDAWPLALTAVADCFGAVGAVMMWQQNDGSMRTISSPGLVVAALDYEQVGWKLDFVTQRGIEQHIGYERSSYTDRHLASAEEIASHPFYTEFRAKHGLGPFIASFLAPPPGLSVVLSLQGPQGRAEFSDEEVAVFESLARHVERALLLTVNLVEKNLYSVALAQALDKLSIGVMILNGRSDILFANQKALDSAGGEIDLADGRLRITGPAQDALERAVATLSSDPEDLSSSRPIVVEGRNGERVVLNFSPIPKSSLRDHVFVSASVMVFLRGGRPGEAVDPALLRDYLGLTLGEARLASIVATGKSPGAAAELLGITEESARTVLKRVFAKTGVSRQSELVAALAHIASFRR